MTPALRNQLIHLSTNESLSDRFRLACRVELGDVSEWLPIETAPDDDFHGFLAVGEGEVMFVTVEQGEYETPGYRGFNTAEFLGLTHWMPLPDPPRVPDEGRPVSDHASGPV